MGLVLTTGAGLCVWIIVWSLNVSGLDAFMITLVMIVIAIGINKIRPYLPGRRDR